MRRVLSISIIPILVGSCGKFAPAPEDRDPVSDPPAGHETGAAEEAKRPAEEKPTANAPLAPTSVPCEPGQRVEMSLRISAADMRLGSGDPGGEGHCTGLVDFEEIPQGVDPEWARAFGFLEGRSVNPNPRPLPGRVHTSTLVFADGRRDEQRCSFTALCNGGIAHGVSFTW